MDLHKHESYFIVCYDKQLGTFSELKILFNG